MSSAMRVIRNTSVGHQVESYGDAARLNDVGGGRLMSTAGRTSRRRDGDSTIWQTANADRHTPLAPLVDCKAASALSSGR